MITIPSQLSCVKVSKTVKEIQDEGLEVSKSYDQEFFTDTNYRFIEFKD